YVLLSTYCLCDLVSVSPLIVLFFFFFFQAEDGIRDRNVTGVQTCALPISAASARPTAQRSRAPSASPPLIIHCPARTNRVNTARSEERRVGKECRSRGAREE